MGEKVGAHAGCIACTDFVAILHRSCIDGNEQT